MYLQKLLVNQLMFSLNNLSKKAVDNSSERIQ